MPGPFDKPALRTQVFVGTDMIGGGKVDFLKRVQAHGTLEGAARDMGVSPTRAWFFLDTLQACFEPPLFEAKEEGGRTTIALTALGEDLITRFEAHAEIVTEAASPFLGWLETVQPKRR
ncbi:MAG: hypothetical protein AAFY59_11865 [Pseudomonadota bacterium]